MPSPELTSVDTSPAGGGFALGGTFPTTSRWSGPPRRTFP